MSILDFDSEGVRPSDVFKAFIIGLILFRILIILILASINIVNGEKKRGYLMLIKECGLFATITFLFIGVDLLWDFNLFNYLFK